MTTGEKMSDGRKKLNLTQQQFADEMGVTRQAVSRWESDSAFPETDTLIKMSELFGCSIDYLLKYNSDAENDGQYDEPERAGASDTQSESKTDKADKSDEAHNDGERVIFCIRGGNLLNMHFEYKSKITVFGLPLVHVNIGLGRIAKGVFSVGLVSVGIVSLGLVSVGVIALGLIALGLLSLGCIAGGIIALGSVAVGIIALGGVAIGCFSLGGCSIGLFATGGYANGRYVAVGDYAVGGIAFGDTHTAGSIISVTKETFPELKAEAWEKIDALPQFWQGFAQLSKGLAEGFMTSPNS